MTRCFSDGCVHVVGRDSLREFNQKKITQGFKPPVKNNGGLYNHNCSPRIVIIQIGSTIFSWALNPRDETFLANPLSN